jgi:hypothetical protein
MKHVKLFEAFNVEEETENYVIGIISEGVDVALFPRDKAMEIYKHLMSNTSGGDYYFPFMIPIGDTSHLTNKKYLLVDTDGIIPAAQADLEGSDYRSTNAGGVTVYVVDDYAISLLQGNDLGIRIYNADGTEEDSEDTESSVYAAELIGGDKYMSLQSYGQGLQNGAYNHFMGDFSEDFS